MKNILTFFFGLLFLVPVKHVFAVENTGLKKTVISSKKTQSPRPNIIFILTDDQRWDAIGYAGNKLAYTPQMNKLAKQGVFFKNTIATTPICSASRASILSGMQERTHKYSFQTADIKEEYMKNAFPKLLRDAGYYTAMYGKFGVSYNHLDVLFDDYEKYDLLYSKKDRSSYYFKTIDKDTVHLTRYTGHKALKFLDNTPKDKPFCLQLSFSAPHASDNTEEQYFWQEPSNHVLKNETVPAASLGEQKYYDALPQIVKDGFNRFRWGWRYDTPEKYQHSVKGYYRMIAGVDYEIEKIRNKLKEQGLDKNTVIILMGDNGQFLGERQMAGKWLMYENSIKVPLIIYDPRVKNQHKDVDEMALNVDIPATILDLAQIESPKSWHGKSLMPFINNKNATLGRNAVLIEHLWEFEKIPPSEGVRTNKWKYFRYVNDKSIEELYDLEKDPKEINNLAKDQNHKTTLNKLRATCERLIIEKKDPYSSVAKNLSVNFKKDIHTLVSSPQKLKFGWHLPKEAGYQSAYQILVASTQEKLDQNNGDLWDSGQVRGTSSINNYYKGTALQKGTRYFWKVRMWDSDNRLSNYSAAKYFEIALTKESILKTEISEGASSFSSNDIALNTIWNSSKAAMLKTAKHSINNENPAIAYSNQLALYVLSNDYAVVRNVIEKQMQSLTTDAKNTMYVSLMIAEDYKYTGNTELIRKYYDVLKQQATQNTPSKDGLVKNISKKKTTLYNCYAFKNNELLSQFAKILNKEQDALDFELAALQIKSALQNELVNSEDLFIPSLGAKESSVTANILPLAFDLVKTENVKNTIVYIKKNKSEIQDKDLLFLFQVLYATNEGDFADSFLKETLRNASTARTNNIAAILFSRNLWGIQPKAPGFAIATIKPQLTTVSTSEILVPTSKGAIKVTYEYLSFRKQIYTVEIPSNMVGEFEMEFSQEHIVKLNGNKISTSFGTIRLTPGINTIELIINTF
tara:strand:+ start:6360 stop:9275 length:2916 start_codon:yes stop_codon:yes gene_type:complete